MSATNDFSRRFFADFIATRIKARGTDECGSRPARRGGAARAPGDPARVDPRSAETAPIDLPRGLRPGLGSSGA
jgi:hypothetical protein